MKLYAIIKDIFDDLIQNWALNKGWKLDTLTLLFVNFLLLILTLLITLWFGLFLWNSGIQPVFPGIVAQIPNYSALFKFIVGVMLFT